MSDLEETLPLAGVAESRLIDAVAGGEPKISRVQAMAEVMRRDLPDKTAVLEQSIKRDAPTAVRFAAIRSLGQRVDPASQKLLIESVAEAGDDEAPQVIRALGKIGDEAALSFLGKLSARTKSMPRGHIEAAQRLIAFRHRVPGFGFDPKSLPKVAALKAGTVEDMVIDTIAAEELERHLPRIRAEAPGLDLSAQGAVRLTCARKVMWLMHQKDLANREVLDSLTKAPWVPMALFGHAHCTARPYLLGYVLAEPDSREGVRLSVSRLGGEISHAGQVGISRGIAKFALNALATRFTPAAEIGGTFAAKGAVLKVTDARVSQDVAPVQKRRRVPQPA